MKSFSLRRLLKSLLLIVFIFVAVKAAASAFQVFVFDSDRNQLLEENKRLAHTLINSYTKLPFDNSLAKEQQFELLFSLMLLEKNPEGLSQLEMLYRAYDLPLLFKTNENLPNDADLSQLYEQYQMRLQSIGENSEYILREDIISLPEQALKLEKLQQVLVISDFQMRDEESPFLLYPLKPYFPTSYYPANPHVPYIVNDALKTFRNFEQQHSLSIDLALFTGDMTDNGHYNEVRWGIDSLDGGTIHPDSGSDDDIFTGLYADGQPNDSSDPFTTVGLENTPWYFIPGNHDGLAMGVFAMTYEPIDLFFTQLKNGTYGFMNDVSIGDINYLGSIPNIRSMFSYWWSEKPFDKVIPDKDRRLLNPADIAKEMFITTGYPPGHGMQFTHDIEKDRSFSFIEPTKNLTNNSSFAIRHIALDTNATHLMGEFSDEKMLWLESELKQANANKELVIISSHHKPIDIIDNGNDLVNLLNRYPNVIAHLVAHWHKNGMQARLGETAELSYWQIETGSMVNWPQQLRILDISLDHDTGIGVIKTTMINHQNDNPYAVSERGRFLSYLEGYLIGGDEKLLSREGGPEVRNTELLFKLPADFLEAQVLRSSSQG
jgi:hypothetical protein